MDNFNATSASQPPPSKRSWTDVWRHMNMCCNKIHIGLIAISLCFILYTRADGMNNQTIDTTRSVTIEIDHQKFQEISWVDKNKVDLIFLPLDEEYPFGDIGKVIFRDQKIFIMPLGMDKIFIYTDRGEAYGMINRYGEGPGEYLDLADFDINSHAQQIIVSDAGNRKFLRYSYDGDFIDEKPVNLFIKTIKSYTTVHGIQYIGDLRYSKITPGESEVYNINLFDKNWKFIKGYFPFSQSRGGMFGHPYMLFSKSDTCIGYYKTFTDSIFHFSENEMVLAYRLKFPKPVFSYDDFGKGQHGQYFEDRIYNIIYDESPPYLILGYMYQGKIFNALYNKINRKIEYFTSYPKDGSCSQRIFSHILGLHGSKMILQASALNVDCIVDVFRNSLTEEQILAFNKVREVDNNFLVLIQL